MDIASPERHEVLGKLTFRKGSIKVQCSSSTRRRSKPPAPSWYDLKQLPRSSNGDVWDRERQHEFRSKIQLRVYYDAASYASDLQPWALPLRSQAIGVLEQPASGQRSAPMAGEGPSTPTASPK